VACGSGGPALNVAQLTACEIVGVELYEEAVANANRMALEAGLETRARFVQADASRPLSFKSGRFDAIPSSRQANP
jgi:tRNA1(Val) A37 N6-methylase TrmN6